VSALSRQQPPHDTEAEAGEPVLDEAVVARSDPGLGHLDVEQRLEYLRRQFSPDPTEPHVVPAVESAPKPAFSQNVLVRRTVKSCVAFAVAAAVVWMPVQRLLQTTSVEAVVNARTLTLRAPIDGIVSPAPADLSVGATLEAGTPLFRITDSRADRSRFDDVQRLRERTESEINGLKTRLEAIERMHDGFVTQTRLFQKGRIAQLEARVEESNSNVVAAETRQQETASVLSRALELDANGFQPKALLEKVQRDNEIAKQDARAIAQRIKGIEVELESARSGAFLGDSYNDRPRSSQRADELQQQIIEISSQLAERQSLLGRLENDLTIERDRLQLSSDAPVLAPSSAKVWELLTAPGEHVQRGQELIRLVDCHAALVTAVVSEAVYNRLQIGTGATFRLRERDAGMPGRVVNLTGVASAAANYAIAPSFLRKEQYRVTVDVPQLSAQGCNLGRTGQVVFADQDAAHVTSDAQ
jgi:multidrug resistance efflux pump